MSTLRYDSITGGKITINSGERYRNEWNRGPGVVGFSGSLLVNGKSARFQIEDDSILIRAKADYKGKINGKRVDGVLSSRVRLDGTARGKGPFRDFRVDEVTGRFRLNDNSKKRGTTRSRLSSTLNGRSSFVKDFMQSNEFFGDIFGNSKQLSARTKGYFSFDNVERLFIFGSGFGYELGA